MARYVARFMKNVLGENGHEAEICQRSIEIEASSVIDATELAKMKFCETERVGDWLLHADRVHLTDGDFPSQRRRGSRRNFGGAVFRSNLIRRRWMVGSTAARSREILEVDPRNQGPQTGPDATKAGGDNTADLHHAASLLQH